MRLKLFKNFKKKYFEPKNSVEISQIFHLFLLDGDSKRTSKVINKNCSFINAFEFQIRFSIRFQRSYIHSEIIPALYILSKRINLKLKENLSKKEQNMNLFSFSISFDINFVLWWVFFVLNWVCWLPSSSRTWYYYQAPNIFNEMRIDISTAQVPSIFFCIHSGVLMVSKSEHRRYMRNM